MKKGPSGKASAATMGKSYVGPTAKKAVDRHEAAVAKAHRDAAKPAGPAGKTFKYPVRMGD